MDPLSITASVIAVLQAVRVALSAIATLQGAPAQIRSLVDEISSLEWVVKAVQRASPIRNGSPVSTQPESEVLDRLLENAQRKLLILQDIVRHSLKPGCLGQTFARLQWLQEKSRVRTIQRELQDIKLNIVAILGAETTLGMSQIHITLQDVTAACAAIVRSQEDILHTQASAALKLIDIHSSGIRHRSTSRYTLPLYLTGRQSPRTLSISEATFSSSGLPPKENLAPFPVVTNHIFDMPGSTNESPLLPVYEDLVYSGRSPMVASTTQLKSPLALDQLLGLLLLQYAKLDVQHDSRNPRTKTWSTTSVGLRYQFPRWLLARAVSVLITYGRGINPELLLRVPRVRPVNADIFRFAETGNVHGMQVLFQHGLASPDDVEERTGITALHKAVDWRQIEMTRFLLTEGADAYACDNNGWTPGADVAHLAFTESNPLCDNFKSLLRKMDLDTWQFSCIHESVLNMTAAPLLESISRYPNDINQADICGLTPLFWAATRGDVLAVQHLLENGADPRCTSTFRETALHWAIEADNTACTTLLLKYGADPNARNVLGTTPLHYAAWLPNCDTADHCRELVRYGANVNVVNASGETPLHYAAANRSNTPTSLLLQHSANPELKAKDGITPLFEAIQNDNGPVAAYLLHSGANYHVRTFVGNSVLHILAQRGGQETIDVFRQACLEGLDMRAVNKDRKTAMNLLSERPDRSPAIVEAFDRLLNNMRKEPAVVEVVNAEKLHAEASVSFNKATRLVVEVEEIEVFEDAVECIVCA